MREINPQDIKKVDIAVAIPSLNEADSIAYVVRKVDIGLQKFFPKQKAVIINADNNSPDGTKDVFLNLKTKTPKIYLSTKKGVKGKGNALLIFLKKMKKLQAKAGLTVDADLKSITPDWIKCFLDPITNNKYNYIIPQYLRDKNDGTITNNICYPLIYGFLGYNIRQPIGGDFGFSSELVDYWLKEKWARGVFYYGIDIFMTLNAIKGNFKIGKVKLGSKIHKPSSPKLNSMFLDVVSVFFHFLLKNENLFDRKKVKKIPVVCNLVNQEKRMPKLRVDCLEIQKNALLEMKRIFKRNKNKIYFRKKGLALEKVFADNLKSIDASLWSKIVYEALYFYKLERNQEIIKILRSVYFARVATLCEELKDKNQKEAELIFQKQAKEFLKHKRYFISLNKSLKKK